MLMFVMCPCNKSAQIKEILKRLVHGHLGGLLKLFATGRIRFRWESVSTNYNNI